MRRQFTCNLIAAVGMKGELGLDGRLPWNDPEDLSYFKSMTGTDVIIVGRRTFETLPTLPGRIVVGLSKGVMLVRGSPNIDQIALPNEYCHPTIILGECFMRWPDKVWWVAGGAQVYRSFIRAGVVRRSIITHVNWSGHADTFFPWDAYGHNHQAQSTRRPEPGDTEPQARASLDRKSG